MSILFYFFFPFSHPVPEWRLPVPTFAWDGQRYSNRPKGCQKGVVRGSDTTLRTRPSSRNEMVRTWLPLVFLSPLQSTQTNKHHCWVFRVAEMLDCFDQVQCDLAAAPADPRLIDDVQDIEKYCLAKSYFDLKEYLRAAHALENCEGSKAVFLRCYSRFLVSAFFLIF
jgi:hypothetical protein